MGKSRQGKRYNKEKRKKEIQEKREEETKEREGAVLVRDKTKMGEFRDRRKKETRN